MLFNVQTRLRFLIKKKKSQRKSSTEQDMNINKIPGVHVLFSCSVDNTKSLFALPRKFNKKILAGKYIKNGTRGC